jgi:hypothetical protein
MAIIINAGMSGLMNVALEGRRLMQEICRREGRKSATSLIR